MPARSAAARHISLSQATASTPRRSAGGADLPASLKPSRSRIIRLAATSDVAKVAPTPADPAATEPVHAGAEWREHDLMIRRFQTAGLTPAEIAVVLHSKGLRVRTWHVSETFVRGRLKALGVAPNASRTWYGQHDNCYRRRLPD